MKGKICGVSKSGVGGIDPSMLAAMLEAAEGMGPKLISSVRRFMSVQH